MDTIHLRLNPAESLIFIPNANPSQRNCQPTVSPRTLTAIVHKLDKSVDNPLGPHITFPQDHAQSSTAQHYLQAMAWASAKVALDVFDSLTSFTQRTSVQPGALEDTIFWLKEHPIHLPWLKILLTTDTLRTLLNPLGQPWSTCSNKRTSKLQQSALPQRSSEKFPPKKDLQLRIPAPSCIPDWPQHLFPRQGDFGKHIKRQQHQRFRTFLSSEQAAKFTLHKVGTNVPSYAQTEPQEHNFGNAQPHCSHLHASTTSAIRPS